MAIKRVQITFSDSLPLGTHGTFKHQGKHWIAVPADKWTRTVTVTDRLLGIVARGRGYLTQWISSRPEDAQRVLGVLEILAGAEELVHEKQKAQTS